MYIYVSTASALAAFPSSPSAVTSGNLLSVSTPLRRRAHLGNDEVHEVDEQDEASIYMSPSIISLHSTIGTVTSGHDDDETMVS